MMLRTSRSYSSAVPGARPSSGKPLPKASSGATCTRQRWPARRSESTRKPAAPGIQSSALQLQEPSSTLTVTSRASRRAAQARGAWASSAARASAGPRPPAPPRIASPERSTRSSRLPAAGAEGPPVRVTTAPPKCRRSARRRSPSSRVAAAAAHCSAGSASSTPTSSAAPAAASGCWPSAARQAKRSRSSEPARGVAHPEPSWTLVRSSRPSPKMSSVRSTPSSCSAKGGEPSTLLDLIVARSPHRMVRTQRSMSRSATTWALPAPTTHVRVWQRAAPSPSSISKVTTSPGLACCQESGEASVVISFATSSWKRGLVLSSWGVSSMLASGPPKAVPFRCLLTVLACYRGFAQGMGALLQQ
mmetsp:Transcript_29544/g.91926  ORF Transcript_29544/g.91926 Transcript_29544/m.91926 type:complete len:361 (-) Transcript_29544:5-1087(-)